MWKKILFIFVIIPIAGAILGYWILLKNNIRHTSYSIEVKIRKEDSWEDVVKQIEAKKPFINSSSFQLVAKFYKLNTNYKPGRYLLKSGSNNLSIVRKIANGWQDPVRLTINNITLREQLAGKVAKKLDIDSTALATAMYDDSIAHQFGFNRENFAVMFIANTYEIYWDVDVEQFLERMHKEYQRFWTDERKAKLTATGLTAEENIILASIVQKETNSKQEYGTIASTYKNRLKIGMPLQADPTVKFALKDFAIKRIKGEHLTFDSPYNTYKYRELPPGPICLPETNVIDAVLDAQPNNYLYFCAIYGSGKHAFAANYDEHMQNAARYRNALNKNNIH